MHLHTPAHVPIVECVYTHSHVPRRHKQPYQELAVCAETLISLLVPTQQKHIHKTKPAQKPNVQPHIHKNKSQKQTPPNLQMTKFGKT